MPDKKITWTSHPARENPAKLGMVITITTLFLAFFWFVAGPWWCVLTLIVVFLSLYSFWLPTRYTLDDEGIEVSRFLYRRRFPWSRFRRYEVDKGGIFLGTFRKSSRLDPFRGLYLVGGHKHPEAGDLVKEKFKTDIP
ncbi:MAG: hypothetical protein ACP5QG_03010 [candidate division WOR-3 bacterium]